MENHLSNRNFNQYKTVEQLVKMGKARTKPISVRLSVDTIDYFEKNAKKFNTKTGTIISDILDDYVSNLQHTEMRNRMETESSLMRIYRRSICEDGEKFLIRNLIDKTSRDNTVTVDDEEIRIVSPEQHHYNGETFSMFYMDESGEPESLVDKVTEELEEMKNQYVVEVDSLNGNPESDYVLDLDPDNKLFVVLGDCVLIPRKIDYIYSPDYSFGHESIFVIPVEDWALVTSLLIECATIKTRQLGREIRAFSLLLNVRDIYNKIKEDILKMRESSEETNRSSINSDRWISMKYRELIYKIARYEDLPSNYERPKDLDGDMDDGE